MRIDHMDGGLVARYREKVWKILMKLLRNF